MARQGPALDAGFPVNRQLIADTGTSITVSTPATAGGSRLIVATVQGESNGGTIAPYSCSGMGLTWTQINHVDQTNTAVAVFAAWASSSVGASSVTVSHSAGSVGTSNNLTVYAFNGTKSGASSVSNAIGSNVSQGTIVSAPSTLSIAISIASTSGVLMSMAEWQDGSGISYVANTTADFNDFDTTVGWSGSSAYLNGSGHSGSTTVGSTFGVSDGNNFVPMAIIAIEVLTAPAPTVSSCSPNHGSAAGGTSVTVTGTNFVSGATIKFGGTSATGVSFSSSTSLTCTTPAHATGLVAVLVTNPDAQTGTANAYTFDPAPTVSSCSPDHGTTDGGTAVTVTGTNFVATPTIKFGGTLATGVSFTNSTTLTCTTPKHTSGLQAVLVTNPDAQTGTANAYTFIPPVFSLGLPDRAQYHRKTYRLDSSSPAPFQPPPPTPPPNSLWEFKGPDSYLRRIWRPEMSGFAFPVGFFPVGPPIDAGFPVSVVVEGQSITSLPIVIPPTTGLDRLIYVAASFYSGSTAPGPITVSGLGLTWTKIVSADTGPPFIQQEGAEIWAAWAALRLLGGTITVSFVNPGPTYAVVSIYARYKTAGQGVAANAFGAITGKTDVSGASSSRNVTISLNSSSAAVVALVDGSGSAVAPLADTNFDELDTTVVTMGNGSLVQGGGGPTTLGMSGNTTNYAIVAAEILSVTVATFKQWEVIAPDLYRRTPWNPERTAYCIPPKLIPAPPNSPFMIGMLPISFMRPIWNPQRSLLADPGRNIAVVVPKSPVPPTLPERFARPRWQPERTVEVFPAGQGLLNPYGDLTAPSSRPINAPFQVTLTLFNPTKAPVGVVAADLYLTPEDTPATIGAIQVPAYSGLPTRLTQALEVGFVLVPALGTLLLAWTVVGFRAGVVQFYATATLSDGTTFETATATIAITQVSS